MIFLKSLNKTIGLALVGIIYFNAYCATEGQPKQLSVFSCIKDSYIKSLDINSEPEVAVDKKQKLKLQIQYPSRDAMRSMVMDQMAKQPHDSLKQKRTILDRTFIDKMELLAGSGSPKNSLLSALDNTDTIFGHIMLAGQLAEPIFDTNELRAKQALVQELLNNSELAQKIQEQLDIIKANEGYFLSYFEKENAVNQELFKKVYWGDRLDFLNQNTLALEAGVRLGNIGNIVSSFGLPIWIGYVNGVLKHVKAVLAERPQSFGKSIISGMGGIIDPRLESYSNGGIEERVRSYTSTVEQLNSLTESYQSTIKQLDVERAVRKVGYGSQGKIELLEKQYQELIDQIPMQSKQVMVEMYNFVPGTFGDTAYLVNQTHGSGKIIAFSAIGALAALQGYLMYNAAQDTMLKQNMYNYLQTNLIGVSSYIKAIENLYALMATHPLLSQLPAHAALSDFMKGINVSSKAQKLVSMLNSNTFNGNASAFSLTGRVLAAHRLMCEVKEEFVPACAAAGSLDVYLSTAKLYKKFEDTPVHFSFVNYVEGGNKPFITVKNFWNPFIDASEVVANDLVMGLERFPNNMILTGPNTGGKSTVIKGLLISILLGQTLGIAPADQLMITPFANLNCYLNITDDLNAGTSLFKAEVLRAKALIEAINNLDADEFSFTIIDEVFSGTSPKEGEEAALQFASNIGEKANSICCMATHFPRLTEELSGVNYKNYSVTVYKDEAGNWVRPFKLAEGKSIMNIALDLLREEGVLN